MRGVPKKETKVKFPRPYRQFKRNKDAPKYMLVRYSNRVTVKLDKPNAPIVTREFPTVRAAKAFMNNSDLR